MNMDHHLTRVSKKYLHLMSVFPALTETFILREVQGLRDLGWNPIIAQLRPGMRVDGCRLEAHGFGARDQRLALRCAEHAPNTDKSAADRNTFHRLHRHQHFGDGRTHGQSRRNLDQRREEVGSAGAI